LLSLEVDLILVRGAVCLLHKESLLVLIFIVEALILDQTVLKESLLSDVDAFALGVTAFLLLVCEGGRLSPEVLIPTLHLFLPVERPLSYVEVQFASD